MTLTFIQKPNPNPDPDPDPGHSPGPASTEKFPLGLLLAPPQEGGDGGGWLSGLRPRPRSGVARRWGGSGAGEGGMGQGCQEQELPRYTHNGHFHVCRKTNAFADADFGGFFVILNTSAGLVPHSRAKHVDFFACRVFFALSHAPPPEVIETATNKPAYCNSKLGCSMFGEVLIAEHSQSCCNRGFQRHRKLF